jgi:RimJ/RimL family protein N-acetyltransferase
MKYSTRKLSANDWLIYKHVRLEALELHPNFFSPTSDEFKFADAEWIDRLSNMEGANFGLFNDQNEMIGLTGIFRDCDDRSIAWLVASYIKAAYRQKGLTRYLYEARIQWAKEQKDISTLIVHHREDNEISRKSHQKFNFEFVKKYPPTDWPNGEVMPYVEYQLKIK